MAVVMLHASFHLAWKTRLIGGNDQLDEFSH
jgi:hypothetical protein